MPKCTASVCLFCFLLTAGLWFATVCTSICKGPLPRRALARPSLVFVALVGARFFRPLPNSYVGWNSPTKTKVVEGRRSHKWHDQATGPEILGAPERSIFTYMDLGSSWNALLKGELSKVRALFSRFMRKEWILLQSTETASTIKNEVVWLLEQNVVRQLPYFTYCKITTSAHARSSCFGLKLS